MSDVEDSLRLFLSGFTARDIAESFRSFDDTTTATMIRAAMETQHPDIVGIRKSGVIVGWIKLSDVMDESDPPRFRPFDSKSVIGDSTSFNDVVQKLCEESCLFVRSFGEVSGLIRISDMQKAPMRMWLFGLVTITEMRVTRLIDEICPHGTWQKYLSEGRIQLAIKLQEERRRRQQQPSLLDCLQFADKGQIVPRDETLRCQTRFSSRRAVETFVNALQDLRNNLAHAQDITGDWDIIRELAMNVHRIVVGPSTEREPVPE